MKIGCVIAFILGVMMPVVFIVVHASLRLRNMKNKVIKSHKLRVRGGVSKRRKTLEFLNTILCEH